MTDPAAVEGMMGMMKGNMAMMIPQTLIMGWINAFFAGFVIRGFRCFDTAQLEATNEMYNSQVTVSIDNQIQVNAPIGRHD